MIPAQFEYEVAESFDHAVELLGKDEDAKLLAGGHSLIPLMKLRFARPSLLVDIGRIGDAAYVKDAGDRLAIGALTTHADLVRDPLLQEHSPLVPQAAAEIGDPQVRHRGTIGGSLAHGDPASDLPAIALALDAEFVVLGPKGERVVPAAQFFTGALQTALAHDEVLTEVRVPKLGPAGWSYVKYRRRAQDWATVAAAAVVRRSNGTIDEAAVALVSMDATPVRAKATEDVLRGSTAEAIPDAAELADDGTDPPSDTNGTAEYRRHLAKVLVRRALEEAVGR
jgi:carbon-monoxide dehydrogenase medium subunit